MELKQACISDGIGHRGCLEICRVVVIFSTLIASPAHAEDEVLRLPILDEPAWQLSSTGLGDAWSDRRDLLVLYHPWEESQADGSAMALREVDVPADWQGPLRLHFYMTDDYDGGYPRLAEDSWLGQCDLHGHRFKQVLVNDRVVWVQDVADKEGVSEPSRFTVALPNSVRATDRIKIAFRMIDKVPSSERLPDDFRHVGTTDGIEPTDAWKFMTHVYFGDVALTPAAVETVEQGVLPSWEQVAQRKQSGGPPKIGGELAKLPTTLYWEGKVTSAGDSWPVRSGVPLPGGVANSIEEIVVRDREGQPKPVQLQVMNRWPDGSLRWVLFDAICNAGDDEELSLDVVDEVVQPVLPSVQVAVKKSDAGCTTLQSGAFRVEASAPGEPFKLRLQNGEVQLEEFTGLLEADKLTYTPLVESVEVLSEGPIRAELQFSGQLQAGAKSFGRFVVRLSVFSGQPLVQLTVRIFNDQQLTAKVKRFELVGRHKLPKDVETYWGNLRKKGKLPLLLRQPMAESFEVRVDEQIIDNGKRSEGLLAASAADQTIAVGLRHFWQQFPKAIEINDDSLRISLFEATDGQPYYLPTAGEAKRHELWIGLWNESRNPEQLQEFAQLAARPPRLFNAQFACATGALGRAAIHDAEHFPELTAFIGRTYPDIAPEQFYEFGIRHWGDQIYDREQNHWRNGYYDRQQGLAVEYLMTGDSRWFDRLEAVVRHIMDVDVCHWSKKSPSNVGAIYGYNSPNHTDGQPWNPTQRTKGMLAYWRLTGDRDARDTALGVADSAIRAERAIGTTSSRDHAGILYCLTAAYDETQDGKYLEAAKRVAHDAIGRIDPRRGCYSEIHGNVSYRGNVPWMDVQLAEPLFDYYYQSGDLAAAQAVVGIADSILTENNSRKVPGDVAGYSHNPHFNKTSGYHVIIAPAIMYAYELTGDDYYLEQARAMYAQTIRENTVNSIGNCYWNTPTLLYYLQRYGVNEGATP